MDLIDFNSDIFNLYMNVSISGIAAGFTFGFISWADNKLGNNDSNDYPVTVEEPNKKDILLNVAFCFVVSMIVVLSISNFSSK